MKKFTIPCLTRTTENDFGAGFYVSPNKRVAETRAKTLYGDDFTLIEFEIPAIEYNRLDNLIFSSPNSEWENTVLKYRRDQAENNWDTVFGPMFQKTGGGEGFGLNNNTVKHWPFPSESQMSVHSQKAINLFNENMKK